LGHGYIITPNALLDPAGQLWERRFDKKNRLTKVIAPTGAIWSFDYDESGNLIKITDPNGAYKEQEFSRQGILTKSTDWEGHPTYYRTDDLGRVVLRQNADYNNVYFEYDRLGNPTKITLPDQNQIFAQYDCDNNLTALTNAIGQTHYWKYSTCKRLLKTTDPLKQTVHYHWGSEHDILEAITNEKGEFCHFTYNPAEQLEEQTGFDGRSLKWVYDPRTGELIKTINGLWQETTYKRDALGRVIEKKLPDGIAERFEYDPNGNLIAAINPDCTVTLERDAFGRIIQETQDDFVIKHQYDQVGNLIHTETNLGTWIDSDYDGNGAITRLNFGDQNQFDWKRNALGQEIERTIPGGSRLFQKYNQIGRLTEQQLIEEGKKPLPKAYYNHEGSEPTLIERVYQYDQIANLITIDDQERGKTYYTYDLADHLLKTQRQPGIEEEFAYPNPPSNFFINLVVIVSSYGYNILW